MAGIEPAAQWRTAFAPRRLAHGAALHPGVGDTSPLCETIALMNNFLIGTRPDGIFCAAALPVVIHHVFTHQPSCVWASRLVERR